MTLIEVAVGEERFPAVAGEPTATPDGPVRLVFRPVQAGGDHPAVTLTMDARTAKELAASMDFARVAAVLGPIQRPPSEAAVGPRLADLD